AGATRSRVPARLRVSPLRRCARPAAALAGSTSRPTAPPPRSPAARRRGRSGGPRCGCQGARLASKSAGRYAPREKPMADEQLERLATEAWLYGYPLVTAGLTKDVMTAVAERDDERRKAPVNQFCHMRRTPDAAFTEVVSPNADT